MVVPHAGLKDYNGAWLFVRGQRIILSVPSQMVLEMTGKVETETLDWDDPLSEKVLHELFGDRITKMIGPVFQGYYSLPDLSFTQSEEVREIEGSGDLEALRDLGESCDHDGWDDSGLGEAQHASYGLWLRGQLVAAANYKVFPGEAGFIGVFTHPEYRGRGHGQTVVQAVVSDLYSRDHLVLYQTLMSNESSVELARRVGIVEYARNMAVRLR